MGSLGSAIWRHLTPMPYTSLHPTPTPSSTSSALLPCTTCPFFIQSRHAFLTVCMMSKAASPAARCWEMEENERG
ncbi:unnamed protein product [Closterium sp. NIES-54]